MVMSWGLFYFIFKTSSGVARVGFVRLIFLLAPFQYQGQAQTGRVKLTKDQWRKTATVTK